MPLVYACIAPHDGNLIPDDPAKESPISLTRESMQGMGTSLQELKPEVLVLISPHGFRSPGGISLCLAEKVLGEAGPALKLEFDLDVGLASAITRRAALQKLPLVGYIYGASSGEGCFLPLDWGAAIPLAFLGQPLDPRPRLVVISPMRDLGARVHYDFGRLLGSVMREDPRRLALIASADQGHAHSAGGPYGFHPAAAEYDRRMQQLLLANDLEGLLDLDDDLVRNSMADSLWPTLILAGALAGVPREAQLLSYEVDDYFGILCAEFRPRI
jgi:aromatic ring-opening dioxygenase LigB subunit